MLISSVSSVLSEACASTVHLLRFEMTEISTGNFVLFFVQAVEHLSGRDLSNI